MGCTNDPAVAQGPSTGMTYTDRWEKYQCWTHWQGGDSADAENFQACRPAGHWASQAWEPDRKPRSGVEAK